MEDNERRFGHGRHQNYCCRKDSTVNNNVIRTKTGWYNNEARFCEFCGRRTEVRYKEKKLFDRHTGKPRYETTVMVACPYGGLMANWFSGQRLPINNHYADEYIWLGSKEEAIDVRKFEEAPV